jgi:hypothetical protein
MVSTGRTDSIKGTAPQRRTAPVRKVDTSAESIYQTGELNGII